MGNRGGSPQGLYITETLRRQTPGPWTVAVATTNTHLYIKSTTGCSPWDLQRRFPQDARCCGNDDDNNDDPCALCLLTRLYINRLKGPIPVVSLLLERLSTLVSMETSRINCLRSCPRFSQAGDFASLLALKTPLQALMKCM